MLIVFVVSCACVLYAAANCITLLKYSDEQFLIPHQITSGINDVITCRLLFNTILHIEDGLMVFVVCASAGVVYHGIRRIILIIQNQCKRIHSFHFFAGTNPFSSKKRRLFFVAPSFSAEIFYCMCGPVIYMKIAQGIRIFINDQKMGISLGTVFIGSFCVH